MEEKTHICDKLQMGPRGKIYSRLKGKIKEAVWRLNAI